MKRDKYGQITASHKSYSGNRGQQRLLVGTLLLAVSGGLLVISRQIAGSGEWYAQQLYPYFRKIIGGLSGVVPFSVAEIGLYGGRFILMWTLIRCLWRRFKNKESSAILNWLSGVYLVAALLLFLYTFGCGINYQRASFLTLSEMPQSRYQKEDLVATAHWLTDEVNRTAVQVTRADGGRLQLSGDYRKMASKTMTAAGKRYEALAGNYPPAKGLLLPQLLSYQQLSGIYVPFTTEANINSGMPTYDQPFTACHELAHFQGFMSEDEANFIAFLACRASPYEEFAYSGNLTAWQYVTNRLRRADPAAYQAEQARLNRQAKVDIKAGVAFWQQYEGVISDWNQKVNDSYLKAQGQTAGVATYGGIVDLVVNHYLQTIKGK